MTTPPGEQPGGAVRMPPSRKGALRKAAIAEAALRLISREGIQGVSMRATAAEAAVPLGTVTYYFSDKDELIEAAFLTHTSRETARIADALADLGEGATTTDLALGLTAYVMHGLTEYRAQLLAEYEFLGESARLGNLQRASAAWFQALRAHLETAVTALSSSSPQTDARLILAVLAGLEVDNLGAPPETLDESVIHATLERLFHGLRELWRGDQSPGRPCSTGADIEGENPL